MSITSIFRFNAKEKLGFFMSAFNEKKVSIKMLIIVLIALIFGSFLGVLLSSSGPLAANLANLVGALIAAAVTITVAIWLAREERQNAFIGLLLLLDVEYDRVIDKARWVLEAMEGRAVIGRKDAGISFNWRHNPDRFMEILGASTRRFESLYKKTWDYINHREVIEVLDEISFMADEVAEIAQSVDLHYDSAIMSPAEASQSHANDRLEKHEVVKAMCKPVLEYHVICKGTVNEYASAIAIMRVLGERGEAEIKRLKGSDYLNAAKSRWRKNEERQAKS